MVTTENPNLWARFLAWFAPLPEPDRALLKDRSASGKGEAFDF